MAPLSIATGCGGTPPSDMGEDEVISAQKGQSIWNGFGDGDDKLSNAVVKLDATWGKPGTTLTEGTSCTGTLVTSTLVLSAVHCFSNPIPGYTIRTAVVAQVGNDKTNFHTNRNVKQIWFNNGGGRGSDVALLELAEPIVEEAWAQKPSLQDTGIDYGDTAKLWAGMVGWGLTEPVPIPDAGPDAAGCTQSLPTHRQARTEFLAVEHDAANPGGIWTIDYSSQNMVYSGLDVGDSGGPLFLVIPSASGGRQQVGVASTIEPYPEHGDVCKEHVAKAIWADITSKHIRDWLNSVAADKKRPGKWLGETDYVGDCDPTGTNHNGLPDQDCDRYWERVDPETHKAADSCPGIKNINQSKVQGQVGPADRDQDGVFDGCDNCPTVFNSDQADSDHDSVGDACDATCNHNIPLSDFKCCSDDSDCPGIKNECVWIFADPDAPMHGGLQQCPTDAHCALPVDRDSDGIPDNCDNCPTTTGSQLDSDGDGVGDVCDKCPGNHDFGHQAADEAKPCVYDPNSPAGDIACTLITHDPHSVCNVNNRCTGGHDSDGDGLGDACDGCPDVNQKLAEVNGRLTNCNADMERENSIYPRVPDVCDPSPCSYSKVAKFAMFTRPGQSQSQVWNRVDYKAITLPSDLPGANGYHVDHGQVTGTVGARYCTCTDAQLQGATRTPANCGDKAGCVLTTHNYHPVEFNKWQVPSLTHVPSAEHWYVVFNNPGIAPVTLPNAELTTTVFANPRADHPVAELLDYNDPTPSGMVAWRVSDFPMETYLPIAGNEVFVPGKVTRGVFWTHVTEVDGMTVSFQDMSNHYEAGMFGIPPKDTGKVLPSPSRICGHLCIDMCPMCNLLDEISNITIDRVNPAPHVYAVNSRGVDDLTEKMSPAIVTALADESLSWLNSAEIGALAPRGSAAFALVSPDDSSVAAVARVSEGRAVEMGPRFIDVDDNIGGTTPAGANTGGSSGAPGNGSQVAANSAWTPTPRTHAATVLSATKNLLFVVGGEDSDGHWAKTLRTYDPAIRTWAELPLRGDKLPRRVLAATYHPFTHSLVVLDQTRRFWGMRWARLIRVDVDTRQTKVIGMWPRLRHTKVFLSLAENGTLLLAASHRRRTFVFSFDVDESTRHVHPRWVLVRRGKLGLSPTLTNRGLTLPMKRHGEVENTFVPATDLHGGTHWGLGSCL